MLTNFSFKSAELKDVVRINVKILIKIVSFVIPDYFFLKRSASMNSELITEVMIMTFEDFYKEACDNKYKVPL